MIYATVNVTIGDYKSTCDNKILLYRGDRNVEIRFVLKGNKFTVLDSTYAQMIIRRPSTTSVFSEPALIQNDTVILVVTAEMIDELKELGEYSFQIRLYDTDMNARATLPPCESALIIEHPIAIEGESAVNDAIVNSSVVMFADATDEDIFTEEGEYIKTVWNAGDLITDAKLNKIETALHQINEKGGSGGGATSAYISTSLPENVMVATGENFILNLDFNSPNLGRGTLKVFINDVDSLSLKIDQGETATTIVGDLFEKGVNQVVVYVLDRVGVMSNSLTFYVRYGSTEISSTFDAYSAYDYGSTIRYYFTPVALDTSKTLTFYMSIDGAVQETVACTSDVRSYFTFPTNLDVGNHYCEAWINDGTTKSNILSFNLIILDATSLVVASDTRNPIVEEGEQLALDYKVYMKGNSSFLVKVYVDDKLVNNGTCGLDVNYYRTSSLTEGQHTVKIEVWDITETYSDYVIWSVNVTESTYEMLTPVIAGSIFSVTAKNRTNSDENREKWVGVNQDGENVIATLTNFAFNNESGWVDDKLIISGNSWVEVPIQPLTDNAKYGFTLDVEFSTRPIGVENAEVLTLWNDEKDCGIKITTEELILRSAEGNQCDLYFTENEVVSAIFVIDRDEKMAKIYLNGVMCEAFALSDYEANGVKYLEDFTVNSNLYLGGYNKNGYAEIKNVRVYEVALATDEILNNFISNEQSKNEQKTLADFQKGDTLPTLTIYCDFSGLGKDDKKPCNIVYNSPDETLYGKSFTLGNKTSQLQYQGTSSMAYPIKNYRLNLRDENGEKWGYNPFDGGQPESRFTLKADFMSSGHWQNTGLAKWINDNLYHYNTNDPKSMNPSKWYDVQNGIPMNAHREAINGFPCRLILINDGETPLNEGQYEPTPGNTKDMGVFNFNNDKDNVATMGFDSDIWPNCASYEVTANSDTSAGAFITYINSKNMFKHENTFAGNSNDLCEIQTYNGEKVYVAGGSTADNSIFKIRNCFKENTVYTISYKYMNHYPVEWAIVGISYTDGTTQSYQYIGVDEPIVTSHTNKTIDQIYFYNPNTCYVYADSILLLEGDTLEISDAEELAYLKESFELRHPDADDVSEDWGFMGIPGEEGTGLKANIDWVDNSTDEEFVADFEQHFHKDYTLRYYLLVIVLGMVDNLGKNMMLDTWDNKIFMPRFYDLDTICSYDNSGQIKFDVDIEMEQGYWNTSASRLWTRIRDLMHDDLVEIYKDMRANGMSYESFMSYFYDQQIAKIPQKYYNMDADIKYLPFADEYIGKAHGDGYEHLKRWLKKRLIFTDTLYDYAPSYNNDVLTIRANTTEEMTIEIETYTPVYQHLSWYNGQMDKKKIDGKVSVTFSGRAQAATDQEVLIYGGSNIKSIKGLSSMNPNQMLIGGATRLVELDATNCPLLVDINSNKANLSPHTYLNKVDLSGCTQLGGALRLNNSPLIREINMSGTSITSLNLPSSIRNLEVMKLPSGITSLQLNDASTLHTLEFDEGVKIQSVAMSNCNALNNIIGVDLLNTPTLSLDNSYNSVAELYFRGTTSLTLRNMSNLERVIYTPNNEYETFEISNVANSPDYTITTFNCPKLSTFMTTAPYRESYNNCVTKDKEAVSYIEQDFRPEMLSDYEIENTGSAAGDLYEMGEATYTDFIEVQKSSNYTITTGTTGASILRVAQYDENKTYITYNSSSYELSITTGSDTKYIRISVRYPEYIQVNGLFPTYEHIQVKDYGDIQPNTAFCVNTLDISNTQFTDVKLLCTTDAYQLKLPETVNNFICDSAFDLDAIHLEDGNFDTVHHELLEEYSTDYEERVSRKISKNDVYLTTDTGWISGMTIDSSGEVVSGAAHECIRDFISVAPSTTFKIQSLYRVYSCFLAEYDINKTFIGRASTPGVDSNDESYTFTLTANTYYVRPYCQYATSSSGGYRFIYEELYTPNLIPSAADGSLIFSMYAPSKTVAPTSGIWDLKGLQFDNFYTFGLNNDVKLSEDRSIAMPARYDDYNITIQNADITPTNYPTMLYPLLVNEDSPITGNLDYANYEGDDLSYTMAYANKSEVDINIPNEVILNGKYITDVDKESEYSFYDPRTVAKYTSNASGVLPAFNNDYTGYTVSENDNGDGTYTTTIIANNTDNIPTSISFNGNTSLLSVDILNTSRVTNMSYMFANCSSLTSLDLSGWDTSQVTSTGTMFYNCSALTELDLRNWKVRDISWMFSGCTSLEIIDTTGWDTSDLTKIGHNMYQYSGLFYNCNKLTKIIGIENWNMSKVTDFGATFKNCSQLTSLDLSNWDTSQVTKMDGMFTNCGSLTTLDLSNWDTSQVTTMGMMFINCVKLTTLDVSSWDTSNVTTMNSMFFGCNALTTLDLSNFDCSKVIDLNNFFYFYGALENFNPMQNISVSFNLEWHENLTVASLMSVINNLSTVSSAQTLKLGPTNLSKLTEEQIAIVTNKGWTVTTP